MTAVMLYQLIYSSRAVEPAELTREAICLRCERNNRRDGITGLLLCDGRRYLQALEGREALVRSCYRRIEADPRHDRFVAMRAGHIAVRQFACWAAAYKMDGSLSLFEAKVRRALAAVSDPELLAFFIGFAALSHASGERHCG